MQLTALRISLSDITLMKSLWSVTGLCNCSGNASTANVSPAGRP